MSAKATTKIISAAGQLCFPSSILQCAGDQAHKQHGGHKDYEEGAGTMIGEIHFSIIELPAARNNTTTAIG